MTQILSLLLIAQTQSSGFEARLGEAYLTPPEPLSLGGYTERGDAVGVPGRRPLRARFVALRSGERTLLQGAVEMLTMPESLIEAVRARLPQGVDLVLTATHTHNAPDSQRLNSRMTFKIPGIAPYSSRWTEWHAEALAFGANKALAAPPLQSQTLKIRRAQMEANRARRQGLPPDKWATLISVGDTPLFGAYAAHPTLHEAKELNVSGDWPGAWSDTGPWIAVTGAIGAASPVAEGKTGEEKSLNLAEKLNQALSATQPAVVIGQPPRWTFAPVRLPKAVPHPEFAKSNKIPDPLAEMAVSRFAPSEASLFLLSWGGWLIVGVPGEPTEEVAFRLRQTALLRGFPRTLVLSHVNGWAGYMLSPEDYDRGGYEATLSFYGRRLSASLCAALDEGCGKLAALKSEKALQR